MLYRAMVKYLNNRCVHRVNSTNGTKNNPKQPLDGSLYSINGTQNNLKQPLVGSL